MADVHLDACCFIYLIEGQSSWRAVVETRMRGLGTTAKLVTSQLARLECRTKPTRDGDVALLGRYDAVFAASRVIVTDVSAAVIDRATSVRARAASSSLMRSTSRPRLRVAFRNSGRVTPGSRDVRTFGWSYSPPRPHE